MVLLGKEEGLVAILMLAEKEGDEENREFYDLAKRTTYTKSFPELVGKRCLGVGIPGWVFTADEHGNMNLFHLDSHSLIRLPHMDTLDKYDDDYGDDYYVIKAVLSADPHLDDDFVLMLIQGVPWSLAYWKPGKMGFTTISTPRATYSDVTWHDGQFYAVDCVGDVIIADFRESQEPTVGRLIKGLPSDYCVSVKLYIVHTCGELWVIVRYGVDPDDYGNYGVEDFEVYKINVDTETFEEVHELGNRALFLGFSASVAIDLEVSSVHGCKPEHIYFTDDCEEAYFQSERGGGKDMGVYFYDDDGTIEPHYTGESYHKVSPPIWIFFNNSSSIPALHQLSIDS